MSYLTARDAAGREFANLHRGETKFHLNLAGAASRRDAANIHAAANSPQRTALRARRKPVTLSPLFSEL